MIDEFKLISENMSPNVIYCYIVCQIPTVACIPDIITYTFKAMQMYKSRRLRSSFCPGTSIISQFSLIFILLNQLDLINNFQIQKIACMQLGMISST